MGGSSDERRKDKMKKILAVALAFAMCLSFGACGKSGDSADDPVNTQTETEGQPEQELVPTDTGVTLIDSEPEAVPAKDVEPLPEGGNLCYVIEAGNMTYNFYEYYTDEAAVYAGINAVDTASGNTLWNYVTEEQYVAQVDNYTVIGPTTAGFVFTKEDVVYCLNPVDGSLEWTSEPMNDWPAGNFVIDDDCNFYFPGYFSASLTVIGSDGSLVNYFETLTDIYGEPIDDGWCDGISMGKDGNLRIKYSFDYPTTYVVDPKTGECVDEYISTVTVEKEDLVGCWMDNLYSGDQHVIMSIEDDLSFNMSTYDSNGAIMYTYDGYFELDSFVDEVGNDWLISHLTSTDDPAFADWEGIGDYVVTYFFKDEESGRRTVELVQANNGDSVLSIYFDMTSILLHDFEPMG